VSAARAKREDKGREGGEGMNLRGFPPAGCVGSSSTPRILLLGSFPSLRSLETAQYYGNPLNHFWPLLSLSLALPLPESYSCKMELLDRAGIAVWDVVAGCERSGSLDRDIRAMEANPIPSFLDSHPSIARIGLNGGAAAAIFIRLFARGFGFPAHPAAGFRFTMPRALESGMHVRPAASVTRLPSSSPVPSSGFRRLGDKLDIWRKFLAEIED
jgi:TDG/mug DNA glycosylase family protein